MEFIAHGIFRLLYFIGCAVVFVVVSIVIGTFNFICWLVDQGREIHRAHVRDKTRRML